MPTQAADAIRVCQHISITGGAPVDRNPKRFGAFYFEWLNESEGGIDGRPVEFLTFDDRNGPANAVQAAERCLSAGADLVVGPSGRDQIVAVAKWSHDKGVPYFHGPVAQKDVEQYDMHAFLGPPDEEQARALATLLTQDAPDVERRYGMVRVNSPFYTATHDVFENELADRGHSLAVDEVVEKDENTFGSVWDKLVVRGVTDVFLFVSAVHVLKMFKQKPPQYHPRFSGIAPEVGSNLVQEIVGDESFVTFHDPSPAYPASRNDDEAAISTYPYAEEIRTFQEVFASCSVCQEDKTPRDDIDWASYLRAKQVHRFLDALDGDTSTEEIIDAMGSYVETADDAYPSCALDFASTSGAHRWHVFTEGDRAWTQLASCVDEELIEDVDAGPPQISCGSSPQIATEPLRCTASDSYSGVGAYQVDARSALGDTTATGDAGCVGTTDIEVTLPPGLHQVDVTVADCWGNQAKTSLTVVSAPV